MHFYRTGVGFGAQSAQGNDPKGTTQREAVGKRSERLRAVAGVLLTLVATMPAYGLAVKQADAVSTTVRDKAASELPVAPAPMCRHSRTR
jgi:hypothetical protein